VSKLEETGTMDTRIMPRPLDRLRRPETVRWETADTAVSYEDALLRMDVEADLIARGLSPELVWLLEHPPIYTAGTSAKSGDLRQPDRFPVYTTGRGGQFTYHGPGQRVAYVMLNLKGRGEDVRLFVAGLEQWLIDTLTQFGVVGERREDRVGVWVRHGSREEKIAALGIRVRRWVSFHGVSLNVRPDLTHFDGIVPCGVADHGVTSLEKLHVNASLADVDQAMRVAFERTFGPA
jgi:lipoyl(octanoyl) transferase